VEYLQNGIEMHWVVHTVNKLTRWPKRSTVIFVCKRYKYGTSSKLGVAVRFVVYAC
jgi:hypothetical protein